MNRFVHTCYLAVVMVVGSILAQPSALAANETVEPPTSASKPAIRQSRTSTKPPAVAPNTNKELAEASAAAKKTLDQVASVYNVFLVFGTYFLLFGPLTLTLVLGLRARLGVAALLKPAGLSLVPAGFVTALTQHVKSVVQKHSNREIPDEMRADLSSFLTEVDNDTAIERHIFSGFMRGMPAFGLLFVLFALVMSWLPVAQGMLNRTGEAIAVSILVLLFVPVLSRAGEQGLGFIRAGLSSVVLITNPFLLLLINVFVAAALFMASLLIGIVALPFYGARFAWKIDRALQAIEKELSGYPLVA